MQAVALLTRGILTQGFYPATTLSSNGVLYFRIDSFYIPADFIPSILGRRPIDSPDVFFLPSDTRVPLTPEGIDPFLTNVGINPILAATNPDQILAPDARIDLAPHTSTNILESSVDIELLPDRRVQLMSTDEEHDPQTHEAILLPTVEPDILD